MIQLAGFLALRQDCQIHCPFGYQIEFESFGAFVDGIGSVTERIVDCPESSSSALPPRQN
jgi:hypothetical protein